MKYDEVVYWNHRLQTVGKVNTTNGGVLESERKLLHDWIKPGSTILDYGIGGGRMLPVYQELDVRCVGFDIADMRPLIEEQLEALPQQYRKFTYVVIPKIKRFPYEDNAFDAVVSFSVLTHCRPENVEFVLNEMKRLSDTLILSAYDDAPLAVNDETYCFLHDYALLFSKLRLHILLREKVNKIRYWVLRKV